MRRTSRVLHSVLPLCVLLAFHPCYLHAQDSIPQPRFRLGASGGFVTLNGDNGLGVLGFGSVRVSQRFAIRGGVTYSAHNISSSVQDLSELEVVGSSIATPLGGADNKYVTVQVGPVYRVLDESPVFFLGGHIAVIHEVPVAHRGGYGAGFDAGVELTISRRVAASLACKATIYRMGEHNTVRFTWDMNGFVSFTAGVVVGL